MGLVQLENSISSLYTDVGTVFPPVEASLPPKLQQILSLMEERSAKLILSSPHLKCFLIRVVPYDTADAHEDAARISIVSGVKKAGIIRKHATRGAHILAQRAEDTSCACSVLKYRHGACYCQTTSLASFSSSLPYMSPMMLPTASVQLASTQDIPWRNILPPMRAPMVTVAQLAYDATEPHNWCYFYRSIAGLWLAHRRE